MRFVTDTHCLKWLFQNSPSLSESSKKLFNQEEGRGRIVVPTIVLSELMYLQRRVDLPFSFEKTVRLLEGNNLFEIYPLSLAVIKQSISFTELEIHDALIVATAVHLDLPLMTADAKIVSSSLVQTLRP